MIAELIGVGLIVFAALVVLDVWGTAALRRRRIEQYRRRLDY